MTADASGRITLLNPAAERLTGWHEADALGREVRTVLFLVDERTSVALPDLVATVQAESRRHDFPPCADQVVAGGGRHPVAGDSAPILMKGGAAEGVVLVFRDVSERQKCTLDLQDMGARLAAFKAHSEALQRDLSDSRQAVQDAEEAQRRERAETLALATTERRDKSALLGDVSDELRTPLNAVLGYTEMLQEEAAESQRLDLLPDLQKIHGAGEHLLSLVNDIRDLARIESGPMELYRETFGVAAMLEEVCTAAGPGLAKKGNILQVQVRDGAGEMDADRVKIKQTLLNLMSAAAGFTTGGAVLLTAGRERDGKGDWITFRLADVGAEPSRPPSGFDAAPNPVIGPPSPASSSWPRSSSSSPRFGGHGLALVMARRFCQMQGGEFISNREPGLGTVFQLRFPAR